MPPDELPELIVADVAGWRTWLEQHHDRSTGVWLAQARKGTTEPTSLTYAQAVDEALCFGWIDGQRAGHDGAVCDGAEFVSLVRGGFSQHGGVLSGA